jgi:hypothetical protein
VSRSRKGQATERTDEIVAQLRELLTPEQRQLRQEAAVREWNNRVRGSRYSSINCCAPD